MTYDVYLSYRREAGPTEARLLQSSLQARGKQSFLDVTDMGAGASGAALLEVVAQIPNFIVILSPGALDGCAEPQDWLRQEIGQALRTGSNIIPVIMPGFAFPMELPEDIRALTRCQGVAYDLQSSSNMFAELVMAILPAQPLKLQFQAAAASPAAPPAITPPAVAAVANTTSFNWILAGLLFVAIFLPTLVTTLFGSSFSIIPRLIGYGFIVAIEIAVATTIVSQKVPNPFVIVALCGLNELVITYFMGALFFASSRLYALGLMQFLYGALVQGSVAVARVPQAPRWMLLVAPVAGASVFMILAAVTGAPGYQYGWLLVVRLVEAMLLGAAFFFGVRT